MTGNANSKHFSDSLLDMGANQVLQGPRGTPKQSSKVDLHTLEQAVALLDQWIAAAIQWRAERDAAITERDQALMQLIVERDWEEALRAGSQG